MTFSARSIARFFVFLLPAAVVFGSYAVLFRIPSQGDVNLQQLCLLCIVVFAALELAFRHSLTLHLGEAGGYAMVFIILLVYATASLCWVENIQSAYSNAYLYILTGVGIVVILTAAVHDFHDMHILLRVATAVYIIVVALGIYEIFSGRYLLTQNPNALLYKNGYGLNFPYGPFYNMNDYATYVTMFLPFVAYETICDLRGAKGKLASCVLALAGIYTVLNANARLCYAALAVFIVGFFAALVAKKGLQRYLKPLFVAGVALIVAILLLSSVGALNTGVLRSEVASAGLPSHSGTERAELTAAAMAMIPDSFFMGVGSGGSVLLVPYYSSLSPVNLHDMPLTIFTEYGIVVFGLYIGALLLLAIRFFCYKGAGAREKLWACICFGSILSFQPASFASSDTTHVTPLWIVIGLWLAFFKLLRDREKETSDLKVKETA
ncbi:MAG: O-antigen ligase family protein [Clostridia bacterium]|nr:O-antigen ligase family protein [Clostridia bacterium]